MCEDVLILSAIDNLYGISIEKVVRVLWAVEVTPVPKSPKILYGVFDLHGKTLPVISLRELLGLPQKEMEIEDSFVILTIHSHQVALLVDHAFGVFELEREDYGETEELFKELYTTHIVKYNDRLTPVLDIEKLIDSDMLKRVIHVDT
ncbi:MAG: chemotaxis protein CheW [Sulfurimonas sp.]|nr:chemotaxis protein CheW [Sulfurimonas sp.]